MLRTTLVVAEHQRRRRHADITQFVTGDHIKHYIYLVTDNFSRKILSWMVAPVMSAANRRLTIDNALQNVTPEGGVLLITDGGPENHFDGIAGVEHQRALIDVQYSNSMIEAHNKILKCNYLYKMDIANGEQLLKGLPNIINDFNNRPHISLDACLRERSEGRG